MSVKTYICLSFFMLFFVPLMAQRPNITFNGRTENGAGRRVQLLRYSDQLTMREVQEDEDEIGSDGTFSLQCYSNYPMLVVVQIENYSQSFYAEPGRTYDMFLPEFDWAIDEKMNVNLAPVALPFVFNNLPDDEPNVSISRFDAVVDSFIYANRLHLEFHLRPDPLYFDTLVQVVNELVPDTKNEFFNRYKHYRLAALRYEFHFISRTKLFEQEIKDKPILYYDENYMHLFLTLFRNSVSKGSRYLSQRQVAEFVEREALGNLMDSLGLDPLLRNEQVREMVALQALSEAYYRPFYFRSEKVKRMIATMGQRTKFKEHKRLIENLLVKFAEDDVNSVLPDFTLPDVDKRRVSLSSFKGKWIYLSFVRVGEAASQAELATMAHFHDSVCGDSSNVVFVTVDCDREFQTMYHALKNSRRGADYKWTWLHFDGNYALLQRYKVASYPTFILLNPNGERQYSVTPSPATGFLMRGPWRSNEPPAKPRFFLDEYGAKDK